MKQNAGNPHQLCVLSFLHVRSASPLHPSAEGLSIAPQVSYLDRRGKRAGLRLRPIPGLDVSTFPLHVGRRQGDERPPAKRGCLLARILNAHHAHHSQERSTGHVFYMTNTSLAMS